MKCKKIPFALLLVLFGYSQAAAQTAPTDVTVGDAKLRVSVPAGTCAYDKSNPFDAQILTMLENGNQSYNKVVLAFSDCKDLEAARQGKKRPATADYGQILSPLAAGNFAQLTRAEFASAMADYFRKNSGIFEAKKQEIHDIVDSASHGAVKMGGMRMLGVLHSDSDLVQVGLIQTIQAGDKTLVFAGVITSTKLAVPITINLYHPYTDDGAIQTLAARAAEYTRTLIALIRRARRLHRHCRPRLPGINRKRCWRC